MVMDDKKTSNTLGIIVKILPFPDTSGTKGQDQKVR